MILFRPEHVQPILDGTKTQTRRLGSKRWRVGAIHQARTHMFKPETTFANLEILEVREERLTDISDADVRAEGYDDREAFIRAFCRINNLWIVWKHEMVWVIKFRLVDTVESLTVMLRRQTQCSSE